MPLKRGSSREVVSQNIKTELAAGRPRAQAIAIALSEAGKSRKKKHPMQRHISPSGRFVYDGGK